MMDLRASVILEGVKSPNNIASVDNCITESSMSLPSSESCTSANQTASAPTSLGFCGSLKSLRESSTVS